MIQEKSTYSLIKYLIIDVDGTMSDGGIYYDNSGNEIKRFSSKDALGFFLARKVGIKTIVLTGRECNAVKVRMNDLKVELVFQNVNNKAEFLRKFMNEHKIKKEEIGYIGDDLNDYEAMKLAGFIGCPQDACKEIVLISNYVSDVSGGYGAVRDIISHLIRKREQWQEAIKSLYGE